MTSGSRRHLCVALALCAIGCGHSQVHWNDKVLERAALAAAKHPPVIVVPPATSEEDPRHILDKLSFELERAGFRVERSGASVGAAQGTAFFVSERRLLTAAHVVGAFERVYLGLGGKLVPARVVALDEDLDVALLELERPAKEPPTVLTLAPDGARKLGQEAYTLGYPMAALLGEDPKVTKGVVSSDSGFEGDKRFFQLSAEVQPGNSGGPVVDAQGQVLGVVTGSLNALLVAAATGGAVPQNVNFATKSEEARALLAQNGAALDEPAAAPDEGAAPGEDAAAVEGSAPPAPATLDLASASKAVVTVKRRKDATNVFAAHLRYASGWDFYHGFAGLEFQLADSASGEVVMHYLYEGSPGGVLKSEGSGISDIVKGLLTRPLFKSSVDAKEVALRRGRLSRDRKVFASARPALEKCVARVSLPDDAEEQAWWCRVHVTPSGSVRFPLLVFDGKALITRESFEQAQECVAKVLHALKFPAAGGAPRFLFEPVRAKEEPREAKRP